jgi:MFS family permease
LHQPSPGFRPLLLLRLLTVVNDNLLRWLVIGLGKRAAGAAGTALVLTIGTAGFVLPFVLLAWLAGWLADRYPKRSVIVWCKAAEIAIVAAAAAAIAWGAGAGGSFAGLPTGLWLLLATLVVIGSQAALLAPAMLGTIPETVPQHRLASANGVFALVTLAATLAGMAGGTCPSAMRRRRRWSSSRWPWRAGSRRCGCRGSRRPIRRPRRHGMPWRGRGRIWPNSLRRQNSPPPRRASSFSGPWAPWPSSTSTSSPPSRGARAKGRSCRSW